MHRAHLELMTDTVTIEPWQDTDGFGAGSYGAGVQYSARVRADVRLVRNREGEQVTSSTKVTVPGPPEGPAAIDPRSRITLPDGSKPPILSVAPAKDERGTIDHFVLRLT